MGKIYTRESIIEMLRSRGINPTHQRIEIAFALFSRQEHLSADQVLSLVNVRHSETSKATVYNTLNLFVEKRLIRELVVDPAKVFYDPNTHEHHHYFDVATGQLSDIMAADIKVTGLPDLPVNMEAEGVDIIVRIRPRQAVPMA